ncbi:PepSY-associated TM helix domain-containing protein [Pseudomonas sp. Gutcm_11s]|uniref:PepSY-associated TM helix domain-containing protein n=1 Tax=Pseudomonas sp. Gutcm_11s TaxID=3026088 RepID=UPI0023608035|nr:PepSY domain-containing protein [Pseudomonas sp. Gutcm_11s]MDD0845235.1 PepSY domain-containing protein [Pseudomonas sp. Gutcm_11s]
MTARALRNWYLVHKWTSLISTVFLLMLCLTGLPLIFHEEIEHYFEPHPELKEVVADSSRIDYDKLIAEALAVRPGEVVRFVGYDPEEPLGFIFTASSIQPPPLDAYIQTFDTRTGELFPSEPPEDGFMTLMLRLHTDMFLGLPGYLFLGFMGLLLVASLVSGVVVYTPFMRKLDFATVRTARSSRLKWLDLHNVLGIVTLAWVLVVGATGVINTLAIPILGLWQNGQLAEMTAPYKDLPPLTELGSLHKALETAQAAAPDMKPSFVAYPGTDFSSQHHYAVFMRGDTPLTARLLKPALVDATTGELTDMREMPMYVKTLLISQPLHFGDYGGLPLKIIWAVLDIISIVILGSGLYLWLGRRKAPIEKRLAELNAGGLLVEGKA